MIVQSYGDGPIAFFQLLAVSGDARIHDVVVATWIPKIPLQLADKSIQLEPTGAALDLLVQKGYDPTYGARQLRRTIQKYVEDPVAEAIVRGQFAEGARIEVDVEGGNFVFREIQVAEPRLVLAER